MKILHVCKSRSYSFLSGIEVAVENLVSNIDALGYNVSLLTGTKPHPHQNGDILSAQKIINIPYFPGRHLPFWKVFFEEMAFNLAAHRWIKKYGQQFDIIHLHGRSGLWFPFKMKNRPKVVSTVHGLLQIENSYNEVYPGLERKIHENINTHLEKSLFTGASHIICVSSYLSQLVQNQVQIPPENLTVLPNGVNIPDLTTDVRPDPNSILYIGRVRSIKGIFQMVEAMTKVDPVITLNIIGSGGESDQLNAHINRLGLQSRIHMLGKKNQNEIWKWLQKSAALIIPSLHDVFGIVKLEAFACKRPVLISNRPGIREGVEQKKNGLFFDPEDIEQIANCIQYCCDHPQEMLNMGESGFQMVKEKFAWDTIARQTLSLYEKVLGNPEQN